MHMYCNLAGILPVHVMVVVYCIYTANVGYLELSRAYRDREESFHGHYVNVNWKTVMEAIIVCKHRYIYVTSAQYSFVVESSPLRMRADVM